METKALVDDFRKNPGPLFVEIIRSSPTPVRAQEIKRLAIDAGAKKTDVDRHWTPVQRAIKLHPQINMAGNKYSWAVETQPPDESLEVLATHLLAKLPPWVARSLVQNVTHALNKTWAKREFEQAKLVADLAVAVEVLQARGDTIVEVVKLFAEETGRKRLWPIGQPGETVAFDPDNHEAEVSMPERGTDVRVVRSGYEWRGGGKPVVAVKAIVAF